MSRSSAESLAADANYSVAQFYRRFRREHGEQPVRQGRRLLLERAAFELTRTDQTIADIALRANFGSFEGFSRAFRRAFGVSPSRYRSLGATEFRIAPGNPIHFAPDAAQDARRQGELTMNMLDRLIGAHFLNMNLLLDHAATLTDTQLDRPVEGYFEPLPWMPATQTLRSLLRVCCGAPLEAMSLNSLRASLKSNYEHLLAQTHGYENDKSWDMTFVDAECDPPQVFSYGGWIGHIVSMQIYRRIACLMALRQAGVSVEFLGPNEFDAVQRERMPA